MHEEEARMKQATSFDTDYLVLFYEASFLKQAILKKPFRLTLQFINFTVTHCCPGHLQRITVLLGTLIQAGHFIVVLFSAGHTLWSLLSTPLWFTPCNHVRNYGRCSNLEPRLIRTESDCIWICRGQGIMLLLLSLEQQKHTYDQNVMFMTKCHMIDVKHPNLCPFICVSRCPWLTKVISPAVPLYNGLVFLFVLANFSMATFMDPGVYPRGLYACLCVCKWLLVSGDGANAVSNFRGKTGITCNIYLTSRNISTCHNVRAHKYE